MRFALIVQPRNLEQVKQYYPALRRVPAGILAPFVPYLPPVRIATITIATVAQGEVIVCPLWPSHFNSLGEKHLKQKILNCLRKAERLGAKVVGLEGSTALLWENGLISAPSGQVLITTGLRLRTQALYKKARLTAKALGIFWSRAEIALVRPTGMEGETWVEMLARDAKGLTLVQPRLSNGQSLAGKIMYETGLAIKVTGDGQKALSKADIVFLHQPEDAGEPELDWVKPGALVCRIIPDFLGKEIPRRRRDLVWLDNVRLPLPPEITWSGIREPAWVMSPALAETVLIARENLDEWFGPGREITIKQVAETAKLAEKYGLWDSFSGEVAGKRAAMVCCSSIAKP